jgi:hypothetical protein
MTWSEPAARRSRAALSVTDQPVSIARLPLIWRMPMLASQPTPVLEVRPTVPSQGSDVEESAAHLLRLCLDLQLDAMLLTLGALAADPAADAATPTPAPGTPAPGAMPWRRWIGEDVDLACRLAREAMGGGAALPPTLGSDLSHAVPVTTIDDLVARYSSMLGLLGDLSRRSEGTARPAGLDEALTRCEARLAELRGHRLVETPPSGLDLRVEQHYLPGELLG